MNKNIRIAKELMKIAKELTAASGPVNEQKINEHIEKGLQDGWDYFVQKLIEYRNSLEELLEQYDKKNKRKRQQMQSIIDDIFKRIYSDFGPQKLVLNEFEEKVLEQYNILSPILPNIKTKNADEIRIKCDALIRKGKIFQLFHAFSILIAREHDACIIIQELIEHINKALNDQGLKIYIKTAKQGNQLKSLKSYFDAAQGRCRMKDASQGIEAIRRNLIVNLVTMENNIIAYASVSNAYVQSIEELAKQYPTIDKFKQWLKQGYIYDEEKEAWIDPKKDTIIFDTKRIKTPQKMSSIKTAGIMDFLKSIGEKITDKIKELVSSAKTLLQDFTLIKKQTEQDEESIQRYIEMMRLQKQIFENFIGELKNNSME